MDNCTMPMQEKRPGSIQEKIDRLDELYTEAINVFDVLQTSFGGVLRPEESTDDAMGGTPLEPPCSTLASKLDSFCASLGALIRRMRAMDGRCDL